MILIIDEDFNMEISLAEYTETMDAFGVLSEEALEARQGPSVSKRMLLLLANKMKERSLKMDDIFDLHKTHELTRDQFSDFIIGNLKLDLKQREVFALLSLFDINKDGKLQ